MRKINFVQDVLPHAVAVALFLLITVIFFNPVFLDNKALNQHDTKMFRGSAKALTDYRESTGEEGLWAQNMFSGMPGYLINVQWGNQVVGMIKRIITVGLPHPFANIFLAFVCYYIMLLSFKVRPYLAMAGALAFGLSSYMIIGIVAGHNTRVGAAATMPLVMAGIHLVFSNRKILGFGVTTAGLALNLRENHPQITYYLVFVVVIYGLIQLILAIREKKILAFAKNIGILVPAALIAAGTFFGPMWAISEYSKYSIRGKSELTSPAIEGEDAGLSKTYVFEFSNAIAEPLVLMIPNVYGGSSTNFLVQDEDSEVYKALSDYARSGDQQGAQQLVNYTSAYWGPQRLSAPYYGGAIICFLFVIGILFADKKFVWWLVPAGVIGIVLSWGDHFSSFNYFMYDYFPGYNKFRSVTFALITILFAMPLLGMLGLEKLFKTGVDKAAKSKLLIAFGFTGGFCLLLMLFAGIFPFLSENEIDLPPWFTNALVDDRKSLLIADALRSFAFITVAFIVVFLDIRKRIAPIAFYAFIIFFITIDLVVVDRRYITDDNYQRKRAASEFVASEADKEIMADDSNYRVYTLPSPWTEARTSYFHNSVGGYHGAKLRRYQDLYDSCLLPETQEFIRDAQTNRVDFRNYGVMNMLNAKYIPYGPGKNNFFENEQANGNAWFVQKVTEAHNPNEELEFTCDIDTKTMAVVDVSKFEVADIGYDSSTTVSLAEFKPDYIKYESQSSANGLVVFSEIYYPIGWEAKIDGQEAKILRANYVLRALNVPAGNHTIEFYFKPDSYYIGNKVTTASSWLVLLILLGSVGWSLKKPGEESES